MSAGGASSVRWRGKQYQTKTMFSRYTHRYEAREVKVRPDILSLRITEHVSTAEATFSTFEFLELAIGTGLLAL